MFNISGGNPSTFSGDIFKKLPSTSAIDAEHKKLNKYIKKEVGYTDNLDKLYKSALVSITEQTPNSIDEIEGHIKALIDLKLDAVELRGKFNKQTMLTSYIAFKKLNISKYEKYEKEVLDSHEKTVSLINTELDRYTSCQGIYKRLANMLTEITEESCTKQMESYREAVGKIQKIDKELAESLDRQPEIRKLKEVFKGIGEKISNMPPDLVGIVSDFVGKEGALKLRAVSKDMAENVEKGSSFNITLTNWLGKYLKKEKFSSEDITAMEDSLKKAPVRAYSKKNIQDLGALQSKLEKLKDLDTSKIKEIIQAKVSQLNGKISPKDIAQENIAILDNMMRKEFEESYRWYEFAKHFDPESGVIKNSGDVNVQVVCGKQREKLESTNFNLNYILFFSKDIKLSDKAGKILAEMDKILKDCEKVASEQGNSYVYRSGIIKPKYYEQNPNVKRPEELGVVFVPAERFRIEGSSHINIVSKK